MVSPFSQRAAESQVLFALQHLVLPYPIGTNCYKYKHILFCIQILVKV